MRNNNLILVFPKDGEGLGTILFWIGKARKHREEYEDHASKGKMCFLEGSLTLSLHAETSQVFTNHLTCIRTHAGCAGQGERGGSRAWPPQQDLANVEGGKEEELKEPGVEKTPMYIYLHSQAQQAC